MTQPQNTIPLFNPITGEVTYQEQSQSQSPYQKFVEAEGCLDLSHSVYYDGEAWQRELSLYRGCSESEQKMRRCIMGSMGFVTVFQDLRRKLEAKGYRSRGSVWSSTRMGLRMVRGQDTSVVKVDDIPGPGPCSGKDWLRVTLKEAEKEEIWYLSVKTGVMGSFLGTKMSFSERELRLVQKEGRHYCAAVVFLDAEDKLAPFCCYETGLKPVFFEGEEGGLAGMSVRSEHTVFVDAPVSLSNLFCERPFCQTNRFCFVSCIYGYGLAEGEGL